MAPGGSVVACVSIDSPVASLPLKMARPCAPLGAVFTGSESNGKPAEDRELSCSPAPARGAAAAESAAAGSSKHISRRVIVIRASWFLVAPAFRGGLCPNFESTRAQKSLDSGPKNLLASLRLSSRKAKRRVAQNCTTAKQAACSKVSALRLSKAA